MSWSGFLTPFSVGYNALALRTADEERSDLNRGPFHSGRKKTTRAIIAHQVGMSLVIRLFKVCSPIPSTTEQKEN